LSSIKLTTFKTFCLENSSRSHSNEWTEFTILNDDKTLFSVDKATGKTTIQSLTVTNEIQLPAEIEAKLALVDTLQARVTALEVIYNHTYIMILK
jgi:hypothetical protein